MKNIILTFLVISIAVFSCKNEPANSNATTTSEVSKAEFTDMDVSAFQQKIKEGKVVVLDVRTAEEYADGHIEGAINFDVNKPSFISHITKMNEDVDYMVYCKSGGRSVKACQVMAKAGFNNLYNLEGGYTAWAAKMK